MNRAVQQITEAKRRYTPSERRVADFCVQTFPRVVFETVARVAALTDTSPPTVMRFAAKAGFNGFSGLQSAARESIDGDWTRALDRLQGVRIDERLGWATRGLRADIENLQRTYDGVANHEFDAIVRLLADDRRKLYLAGGEITYGTCLSLAALLRWIRDDVEVLGATVSQLPTQLAHLQPRSVLFCFHFRRVTRVAAQILEAALRAECQIIVVTNSPNLTLPEGVAHVVVLHLRGAGDVIDSYTAAASIANTFAAAVAEARRSTLLPRFDNLEAMWQSLDTYTE